jgi:hypothetical protein
MLRRGSNLALRTLQQASLVARVGIPPVRGTFAEERTSYKPRFITRRPARSTSSSALALSLHRYVDLDRPESLPTIAFWQASP